MRVPPVIERILRRVVLLITAMVVGYVLLFGAFVITRWWTVTSRIDQDGGRAPSWLPTGITDLHVRGTGSTAWFSGRATLSVIEAWAGEGGIPLKQRRRGRVTVADYGKIPLEWTSPSFHRDESIRTYLDDAEEIIWERRDGDGGGITLHYIPSLQVFHGSRALW